MQPQHDVEELFQLAYKDDLTGLYNRRYFNRVICTRLAGEAPPPPYCFFMMDIDFFKEINDTHGHKNGDRALCALAGLLQECFQGEEVPVRFAGDEFTVYLPGTKMDQGLDRAGDLVRKGSETVIPLGDGEGEIRFTRSVGAANFPESGQHWEEVLERADQALYAAKQAGRNRASSPRDEAAGGLQRGDDLSRVFPCPAYLADAGPFREILDVLDTLILCRGTDPTLLLCAGERGCGKSRLLREAERAAAERNLPVLRLCGTEPLQDVCYGSLVRGLLRHAGSWETLRERAAGNPEAGDDPLWQTFFSPDGAPDEPRGGTAPRGFFRRLLQGLAGEARTLVLLVDDAEFLDPETLELLQEIRDAAHPAFHCFPVLTLARGREAPRDADERTAGTRRFLDTLASRTLEIPPLSPEQVQGMVEAIFPTLRVSPSFHRELAERSRGNPLYVEEALKYLVQRQVLVYRRSAWNWRAEAFGGLPESLESLLDARLAALDPEVRALLEKASVMGEDIDPELLRRLGDHNEGYVLDLLEQARKAGILHTDGRWQAGAFHFNTREALSLSYERVPEDDRISWHAELAHLLRTVRQGSQHLNLAPLQRHYRLAGQEQPLQQVRDRLAQIAPPPGIPIPARPASRRRKEAIEDPVALSQQQMAGVLSIFHLLRAAVQTWRLYPETSQAVAAACARLHEGFRRPFEHAPSVHLSEAEGTLLVNGEALGWKGEEKKVADSFCATLSAAGLKDIAFRRGLSLEEIKTFLRTWVAVQHDASDAPARWEAFENAPGMENVQINAKVYVAVSETALMPGAGAMEPRRPPAHQEVHGEAADLLASLREGIAALSGPEAAAGEGAQQQAEQTRTLLEKLLAFLQSRDAGLLPPEAASSPAASPDATTAEAGAEDAPGAGLEIVREDDVRCALADILSGDAAREARGYRRVSEAGPRAVEPLYFTLTQTDDAHEGRLCARFLASLAPEATPARILADLGRAADPSVRRRLVQYAAPVLKDAEVARKILLAALESETRGVAMEALHQVEALFPEEAASVLLAALPRCPAPMRTEIYACLGRLRDGRCVPPLLRSLDDWRTKTDEKSIRDLESACEALGNFADPAVVEKLAELLATRSRLPWRKSVPAALRRAALKTLLRIGGESVHAILAPCASDPDPWIRLRSKQFLQEQGKA